MRVSREKAEFASQLQENEEELQVGYKGVIMFTRVFCVRKRLLCTQVWGFLCTKEVIDYTGDYTLNFKGYTVHRSLGGYCVQ